MYVILIQFLSFFPIEGRDEILFCFKFSSLLRYKLPLRPNLYNYSKIMVLSLFIPITNVSEYPFQKEFWLCLSIFKDRCKGGETVGTMVEAVDLVPNRESQVTLRLGRSVGRSKST